MAALVTMGTRRFVRSIADQQLAEYRLAGNLQFVRQVSLPYYATGFGVRPSIWPAYFVSPSP